MKLFWFEPLVFILSIIYLDINCDSRSSQQQLGIELFDNNFNWFLYTPVKGTDQRKDFVQLHFDKGKEGITYFRGEKTLFWESWANDKDPFKSKTAVLRLSCITNESPRTTFRWEYNLYPQTTNQPTIGRYLKVPVYSTEIFVSHFTSGFIDCVDEGGEGERTRLNIFHRIVDQAHSGETPTIIPTTTESIVHPPGPTTESSNGGQVTTSLTSSTVTASTNGLPSEQSSSGGISVTAAVLVALLVIALLLLIFLLCVYINIHYVVDVQCPLARELRIMYNSTRRNGNVPQNQIEKAENVDQEIKDLKPYKIANSLPSKYVLSGSDLKTDGSEVICEGQFSKIHQGNLKQSGGEMCPVIVKINKTLGNPEQITALLNDIQHRVRVADLHPNIASILGVHIDKSETRVSIVMDAEWARSIRDTLVGKNGYSDKDKCGENVLKMPLQKKHQTLAGWCKGIAYGMEFLHAQKIVHANLAAENILAFPNNVVKITGFSHAQQLEGNSKYFIKSRKWSSNWETSGWKWMPMESLRYMEFSKESDVWSFGVVMWEIFSMGAMPYSTQGAKFEFSIEFVQKMEFGHRLGQPQLAPKEMFDKMNHCWSRYGKDRPTFTDFSQYFNDVLAKEGMNQYICV